MHRIGSFAVAITLIGAAAPLSAQSAGTWELGAFGRWTRFSDDLALNTTLKLPADNGFGGGLRLGYFLFKNLEIEADASLTSVDAAGGGKVRHIPLHAGLSYHLPLAGNLRFFVGGRFVNNWYTNDGDLTDQGVGAVVGFRFGPLRVEGTLDYVPKDAPIHGSYHNMGVNAGLSLLLGGCDKSEDGVTISPTTATLAPGERASFTATALRCGDPANVTWSATGGTVTQEGQYTGGPTAGSYQVTVTEPRSGLSSSATVVIRAPAPPPPPARTLSRIELLPESARVRPNEAVSFRVTGHYSDATTADLPNCALTATGNPARTGGQLTWSQPGSYAVTAACEGQSDQSAVEVILEVVIYVTNFAFDIDRLTPGGRDSVRVAAEEFKKYPDLRIRLEGHADFVGSDAYNCALSWRRVRNVERALIGFGIGRERITSVQGFGESVPVPEAEIQPGWRERNTQMRDKGQWWDRRVIITSAQPRGGATACQEPGRRQ